VKNAGEETYSQAHFAVFRGAHVALMMAFSRAAVAAIDEGPDKGKPDVASEWAGIRQDRTPRSQRAA
jgi:hypothetical protein